MDWITTNQAARLAGVKPGTLRQRRRREGSRHPRWMSLGGTVLYELAAFRRYLAAQSRR
jgi:hypothetical protein